MLDGSEETKLDRLDEAGCRVFATRACFRSPGALVPPLTTHGRVVDVVEGRPGYEVRDEPMNSYVSGGGRTASAGPGTYPKYAESLNEAIRPGGAGRQVAVVRPLGSDTENDVVRGSR
ncbi:hypothetical protein CIB48_g7115 [Xylaria polymorpha]|nr:hypothetical protein CIB48_g7115 [Xylaria polymorpha]